MADKVDLDQVADAGDGDADHLLDRILRNALGQEAPQGADGLKREVKGEGVKREGGVKGEQVKGEGLKGEGSKREKNEIKSEALVKREVGVKREKTDIEAVGEKKKKKKRSRSGSEKKKKKKKSKRRRSSDSSRSCSKSPVQAAIDGLPQARVVAVRGTWAQYLSPAGETFYKNVLNGEVQWQKPGNFDCQPSRRAGEMTPAPGEAACYIFHMPPEWSEADLMQLFAPFGQVTSAHVQRDANGFSRSCGFVTYSSAEAANQATDMMNGFGVDGKFLKVSLTQFSLGQTGAPAP